MPTNHGIDIKGPTKGQTPNKGNDKALHCQPASKFLPMIEAVSFVAFSFLSFSNYMLDLNLFVP
ncbi:hypothetical protein S245_053811, partial [Arachis hypogaea]